MTRDFKSDSQPDPIEAALSEFRNAWFSGERFDPETFCADHPECGPELLQRIRSFLFAATVFAEESRRIGDDQAAGSLTEIGDYRIIREIGRGGMGTVYEAEQISLKRKVALKVLPAHLSISRETVAKFHREAEAGGRQNHPGLVSVFAMGEEDGTHYIVQELVPDSHTLEGKLDDLRRQEEIPRGYFRKVARIVALLAEAMDHAHRSGVIHRDLKPANILLTAEEQPKVTDFGLAKIEDALSLTRTGDFSGTPYYMSPEQAVPQPAGIDLRTDIYSLGITLYEMLTLRKPFDGHSSQELFKLIIHHDPLEPHQVHSRVPRDLSTICLKAIEKAPERRYQTMGELSEDLNRFLSGDVIWARPVGFSRRMWKWVKRNPVVSAAVTVALAAVIVFSVVLPWIIVTKEKEKREAADKAKTEIAQQRDIADMAKQEALAAQVKAEKQYKEIIRLSDMKRLTLLEQEAEAFWPAHPEKAAAMEDWLARANRLAERLAEHRAVLHGLREEGIRAGGESAWRFDTDERQWQHDALADLVSGLERLRDKENGLMADVKARLAFARSVRKHSIDDHRQAWDEAIASIGDYSRCPQYNGLDLEPQLGLVPIGQDPQSGLWEFSHLQTGEIPERDAEGRLVLTEEMGIVFVLVPGGAFTMGARLPSSEYPLGTANVDALRSDKDGPPHRVILKPFLFGKFEMTQGQWLRFTGRNPSLFHPGKSQVTLLHPVELVSWDECAKVMARLGLRLPTEAEWEYATRAGTTSVWWTGNHKESLAGAANLADMACQEKGGPDMWPYEEWLDDGQAIHAPVGRYRANPFGLHDVHGNIWEWCQDAFALYEATPRDGSAFELENSTLRVNRGGSWSFNALHCRSAGRSMSETSNRDDGLGLRPAADLRFE